MATRLVTGAWPLKPGVIFPADLGRLVVKNDAATEIAVGVSASRALFPDGSCRSVHLQFEADLTVDVAKTYTVTIGGARRTTTDRTYVETIYSGASTVPAMDNYCTFVPANSQYWCDTFAALVPLKPEASENADAAKTFFQTASGTASTFGEWTNSLNSTAARGVSTYEHLHGYLCGAIRADSQAKRLAYYARFWKTVVSRCGGDSSYRIGTSATTPYAKVWGGADSSLPAATNITDYALLNEPAMGDAIGLAASYIATGWRQPWRQMAYWASWKWKGATEATALALNVDATYGIRWNTAAGMSYVMAAYVIGATMQVQSAPDGYGNGRPNGTASWTNDLTWMMDALEDYIMTTANTSAYLNGIVGQRPTVGVDGAAPAFPTFQLAVAAKCLIFYYQNIDDDTRIPTWLQTMADFVIGQAVDETTYYSMPYTHNVNPSGVSREPYELAFHSQLFGFVYASTANATYQTWAIRAATARELTNPSPFTATVKALGEFFGGNVQSAKFYIDGGAVRPVSGAHPTSISTRTTYES